jgi:hypothetical protein
MLQIAALTSLAKRMIAAQKKIKSLSKKKSARLSAALILAQKL